METETRQPNMDGDTAPDMAPQHQDGGPGDAARPDTPADAPADAAANAGANTSAAGAGAEIRLDITGMTCASCAGRVEKALRKIDGVRDANVNLALNNAQIAYDRGRVRPADLTNAIRKAGYDVAQHQQSYDIDGMTCANCALRLEKVLGRVPGVADVSVNFALERADVTFLGGQGDEVARDGATDSAILAAVEKAGFHGVSRRHAGAANQDGAAAAPHGRDRSLIWLGASVALIAPLVAQMVWMYLGLEWELPGLVQLALATPVQFIIGWRFYRGAFMALRNASANMDVLVALGTTAAYALSIYNMLMHAGMDGASAMGMHLYFEASSAIVTLILAGKIMEERAKRGASAAIRELMALRPRRARRIDPEKGEVEVDIAALAIGDVVRVLPGERVPVDGVVYAGDSEFDESLITGETRPVARMPGDPVVGGAVNGTGRVDITVGAIGEDTTLSRIIRLVEHAQTGKAPVQKMVDRVSSVFVPVIVVIALVTAIGWLLAGYGAEDAIVAAVSVLVIACPCALGLATPTALVAGTGAAARNGILIRNFDALEQAHNVDTVVFDKTGTLTEGRPTMVDCVVVAGRQRGDVLRDVGAVQAASEHPLARAIVTAARDEFGNLPDISGFIGKTGAGVMAMVENRHVVIGTLALFDDQGIRGPDDEMVARIGRHEKQGETVVLVAIDGVFAGFIALADQIRPHAKGAIADLKARGITSIMLSGDSADVAAHVAGELSLEQGYGRIRPQDKAREVEKLRKAGRHVAMVGDGINDAPALAAADVGIAMGGGTDVAMETAGITLMRSDPALVAGAIDISIATRRKIAQNLFWAFGYNVIGVPLAAFGILSPALAGAAMALSSVSVVSNSLMLRRWKLAQRSDTSAQGE